MKRFSFSLPALAGVGALLALLAAWFERDPVPAEAAAAALPEAERPGHTGCGAVELFQGE